MIESKPIAIVWHSRTGASEAMAAAIAEGAAGDAVLFRADLCRPDDLLPTSAFIFVCPENLGTMSGVMKDMFDRCYYPLLGKHEGRPYATAIAAGSAGQGAEAQIDRIVTGWRLRRVAPSLIVNLDAQTPEAILAPKALLEPNRRQCQELGMAMAEGVRLCIF